MYWRLIPETKLILSMENQDANDDDDDDDGGGGGGDVPSFHSRCLSRFVQPWDILRTALGCARKAGYPLPPPSFRSGEKKIKK